MIVARYEVPGKRPPKEPSRRVRYDRALLIPEVFFIESAFRTDVRSDGPFPEHIDSSVFTSETSSFRYGNYPIEVRTPARIRPYPTGRLFWGGDSQALRARLRSICPSRTKTIRPWEASLS
jgi:hypothetical protein